MKKLLLTFMVLTMSAIAAVAQDATAVSAPADAAPTVKAEAPAEVRKITGTLLDKETREPVLQATIQLLKAEDSTYVAGAVTDMDGVFTLKAPANGKYIIKMSNVGYKQVTRNVTIADDNNFAFGKVNMETDAVLLKEVVANGVAAKVVVKEDTFIYNASAYRTPEGSVIEELVKRLPGAQIDDDGKITINGKEVKKIKVDGKEFMMGDTQTALKNLPTAIVEKVKAYDEKSDLAKMTGVDDGEESTVLDFGIKRGMNKGVMSNVDLAVGTKHRYSGRAMGGYMKDTQRFFIMGNMNNTNDRGFGRGGGGGGGGGLRTNKMLSANYNYEIRNKFKLDLSLRWNHNDNNNWSKTETENFVGAQSFSNSISQNNGRSNSWNFNGNIEWKPDTMTTIQIRPSFSTSSSDSKGNSFSSSFHENPFNYVPNPNVTDVSTLRALVDAVKKDSILVNTQDNNSLSYSNSKNFGIQGTINRRLSNRGNNLTWQGRYNWSNSDSESLNKQEVTYFQIKDVDGNDSIRYRNRYNLTPSKNWSFQTSLSYTERMSQYSFLVMRYMYRYTYRNSNRSTYDFSQISQGWKPGIKPFDFGANVMTPQYRDFGAYINNFFEEPDYTLNNYYVDTLSRYSTYDNYIHEIELTWRRTTNNYNLNLGVMYQPQLQNLAYKGKDVAPEYKQSANIKVREDGTIEAKRTVHNVTPTLDFRYRWTKQKSIRLNYRGNTNQPSMTDMLPIIDDSNPLNITKGNPELKPSFTQNASLRYNNYIQRRFTSIMSFVNYSNTQNSVSSKVTYDDQTGGRTTKPENINGNWNISGAFMYNTSLDTLGRWNVNTMTNIRFANSVNYVTLQKEDQWGNRLYKMYGTDREVYVDNSNNIIGVDGLPTGEKVKGQKYGIYNNDATKNYTRSTSINERLGTSYRNSWLEVELNGEMTYNINRNLLRPESNLDTWHYNYGTDITLTAPWGMGFSTSFHVSSRRGYDSELANTDEFIWNIQLSQSVLKQKNLTFSLQAYDILNQRSSFSRAIDANSRRDSWTNAINCYGMLHVIYRFNAFGGKAARQEQRANGGEGAPGMGDRGMRGGGGSRSGGGMRGGGFGGGGRF